MDAERGNQQPVTNRIRCLAVFLPLLLLQACTEQAMYEAVKNRQKVLCQQQPRSEYQECMEQASESYDTYKKNREDAEAGK